MWVDLTSSGCSTTDCLTMNSRSDGFSLNVGPEEWQKRSVALCYAAALELGLQFKLFLSFDMTCMRMAENTTSRVTECKYVPVRIKVHLPTAMMYESTRRTLDTILVARQLNQQH